MCSHIATRRGWILVCAVGILFSLAPSAYAHDIRVGIEAIEWEDEEGNSRTSEEARQRLGTALIISGLILNVAPLAVGLPVTGIIVNEDINIYTAIAAGIQLGTGAAGGLFGGILGLTADFTWRNFSFGATLGGVLGVAGGILAYTFVIPPPDGGTAVGLYTAMIQTGFAGLLMWITGIALGGLEAIAPHRHAAGGRQPLSAKEQDVYVAFTGSHVIISY